MKATVSADHTQPKADFLPLMKESKTPKDDVLTLVKELILRFDQLEKRLALSVEKESYTVAEAAVRLDRSRWTVREWCNQGQAKAKKVRGKGRTGEWRIPHEELVRLQNEGPCRSEVTERGEGAAASLRPGS
jgi:hypothetical protein